MSDQQPTNPFLTPLPVDIRPMIGLLEEDSEKRVLREKLEIIEAQDLDQLVEDLKKFSGLFNQNLQTIVTESRVEAANTRLPFMNHPNPFTEKNDAKKGPVAKFIRPTNSTSTPLRPARRYQPPLMPVMLMLPGPVAAPPQAPSSHRSRPVPHNPLMGPSVFPPAVAAGGYPVADPARQPVQNPGGQGPQPGVRLQGVAQQQNNHPLAKSFLVPPRAGAAHGAGAQYSRAQPGQGGAHHNHPDPNQGGPAVVLPYRSWAGQQQMALRPLVVRSHAASRPPLQGTQKPQAGVRSGTPVLYPHPGRQSLVAPDAARPPLPAMQPHASSRQPSQVVVQHHHAGAGPPRPVVRLPPATSRPLPAPLFPQTALKNQAKSRPPLPVPQGGWPIFASGGASNAPAPSFQPGAAFHPAAAGPSPAPSAAANRARAPPPYPVSPLFFGHPAPYPNRAPNPAPAPHTGLASGYAPPSYAPPYRPAYATNYAPPSYASAPSYVPPAPAPAPVYAPVIFGPLPGRPGALVWFDVVPGQKGPAWVAVPQQGNGRRRFVPKPTRGGVEGMRERGSPLERRRWI